MDTPLVVDWLKMFNAMGAPLGNTQYVINAAMRFAEDSKANGQCAPYLPLILSADTKNLCRPCICLQPEADPGFG